MLTKTGARAGPDDAALFFPAEAWDRSTPREMSTGMTVWNEKLPAARETSPIRSAGRRERPGNPPIAGPNEHPAKRTTEMYSSVLFTSSSSRVIGTSLARAQGDFRAS
jgi:hypothetical protein